MIFPRGPSGPTYAQLQELGFKVNVLSVSDSSTSSRAVMAANNTAVHVYEDMNMQGRGARCTQHRNGAPVHLCHAKGADFACTGTMCTPYSTQRAKRFAPGNVMAHPCEKLTSQDLLSWISFMSPLAGLAENVAGWDSPESVAETVTPLQRPGPRLLSSGQLV